MEPLLDVVVVRLRVPVAKELAVAKPVDRRDGRFGAAPLEHAKVKVSQVAAPERLLKHFRVLQDDVDQRGAEAFHKGGRDEGRRGEGRPRGGDGNAPDDVALLGVSVEAGGDLRRQHPAEAVADADDRAGRVAGVDQVERDDDVVEVA